MIDISDELQNQLTQSFTMRCAGDVFLGDELIASDIPIASGTYNYDRSQRVPESIDFTVPSEADGVSYEPINNDDPLSSNGQQIVIRIGIDVGEYGTEWVKLGTFVIIESDTSGYTVSVTVKGLLHLIDEARFTAAFQPTGTFIETVRALVEPAITVVFDDALTDRNVPVGLNWDEDRLGGLLEVLDAWPAEAEMHSNGYLYVHVPSDPTSESSVWDVSEDADSGTVVQWQGGTTRDGAFNCVVARGETSAGEPIQAVVYDSDADSSTYYGGPFNALPVPFMYYSPLLTTIAQCTAAANTIMARKKRSQSRQLSVNTLPHPALVGGDVVSVTGKGLSSAKATIETFTFPLTPDGGSMSMNVSVV